ncbi:MAG: alginate lyase family protein [Luteolibacter sp.]
MKSILCFLSLLAVALPARAQVKTIPKFNHPGVVVELADLTRMKAKMTTPPWSDGYAALAAKRQAAKDYKMKGPFEVVGREPNLNRGQFEEDCMAVFYQAIQWHMTGDRVYAEKGIAILNAWAETHKKWSGGTARIGVGEFGFFMVMGAEILRHTYPGWPPTTTARVENYFKEVFWPLLEIGQKGVLAGANQGAMQLQVATAIAVFCDDQERLAQIIYSWYIDGAATPQNSLPNGQLGDMGRHQPHALIQIRGLALTAETFYKQGIDLYSELDNRLLAVGEYFSDYNLGNARTFLPYGCTYGYYFVPGNDKGIYQWANLPLGILQNAYVTRTGGKAPFIGQYLDRLKVDENTFLFKNDEPSKLKTTVLTRPPALPEPAPVTALTVKNIGHSGAPGSVVYKDGTWTLQGAGKDIWTGDTDSFVFAYRQMKGDGVVIARITGLPASPTATKAGVMIRENLEAKAPERVALTFTTGLKCQTTFPIRGKKGSQSQSISSTPWWVKLERRGNRVNVYHCSDGVNWSITASVPTQMEATVYVGLVLSTGKPEDSATVTFDQVKISPTP